MKRSIFFIVAVLYISLVFAAGIKEISNYTIPNAEYDSYMWGDNGSLLFIHNQPGGAEARYVPPGFPPNQVYTQTLPTDGADHVLFLPSFENTDVFAIEAVWGLEHVIYGYKTGKKIINTGEIRWDGCSTYGIPVSNWRDDTFFHYTLTETIGVVDVQMYNNNFKRKMDGSFECDTNTYGYPPVWPSPHGRHMAIDQVSPYTATLEADIYRTGRNPQLMGTLETHGSLHFTGPKDKFILHYLDWSPTSHVYEFIRIGSLNSIAEMDSREVLTFALNTKGKGSVGIINTNNMLTIKSEKRVSGPFAIPEAETNDLITIAHFYGSDIILRFSQPGNIRFYGYKVSKKGLKKKTGPETYNNVTWNIRTGKYLSVLSQSGTIFDYTIYTTKLKKIGTIATKGPIPPVGRVLYDITADTTNTKFKAYKW